MTVQDLEAEKLRAQELQIGTASNCLQGLHCGAATMPASERRQNAWPVAL